MSPIAPILQGTTGSGGQNSQLLVQAPAQQDSALARQQGISSATVIVPDFMSANPMPNVVGQHLGDEKELDLGLSLGKKDNK